MKKETGNRERVTGNGFPLRTLRPLREKKFHSAAVKFLSFSPPQARIGKLKIYTAGILYQFISTETG